jgi:hypothetical protein
MGPVSKIVGITRGKKNPTTRKVVTKLSEKTVRKTKITVSNDKTPETLADSKFGHRK